MLSSIETNLTATSARKDVRKSSAVKNAEKAIGEYATVIGGAYEEAQPILYAALGATYAAVLDLDKHPEDMQLFLDDVRSGPVTRNPVKPVVRKLWKGVTTRDTLHRYASALAMAKREKVKSDAFVEWVKAESIKKAAAKWSKVERSADEKKTAQVEQISKRDQALAGLESTPLPAALAKAMNPGLHMAVIRITTGGKGELFLFAELPASQIDAFIIRAGRS